MNGRRWPGLLAVVALLLGGGCTVREPDAAAWRDQAQQTLEDVESQVATARLTVAELARDNLPAAYGVVVMADAEEAVSTAEEGLSSLQPPPGLGVEADRTLELIGRAADAVRRARETVVAGQYQVPVLLAQLDRLISALERRRASL